MLLVIRMVVVVMINMMMLLVLVTKMMLMVMMMIMIDPLYAVGGENDSNECGVDNKVGNENNEKLHDDSHD